MYHFADVPDREDFLHLAEYMDVNTLEKTDRTAPALTPVRERVAARLREIAGSLSGAPSEEDRRRYQALRLFVR